MNRNSVLKMAEICANVLGVVLLILIGLELAFLVLALFTPELVSQWIQIKSDGTVLFSTEPENNQLQFNHWLIGLIFLLMIFQTFLFWKITKASLLIIRSIENFDTFNIQNATALRKLGNLVLILFALQLIKFLPQTGGGFDIKIGIEFGTLLMALIFYILSEVFREGNKLQEEQNLTI
ncbi:DUF2975 domain-containing protein [Algoriphagus halophilus]|uniref:DUF2975 domain-containing protein n=1 Tax=Algoriphagus halophilus TaxID=226505 RepID=A0A1N6D5W0_9BACT|nr:DUF2975 domain-containing protein [Algoriphagus halophilus]SIN66165.1 Protein of unknown function [Algoriphagus halophilus]